MEPKLSLIVAKSKNNVIGIDGDLPWHLSSDLQFFKKTTMGKPVLMGRVTWEGLPFPLPGRPNLVLTRNANYISPPAEVFTSIRDFVGRGYELAGEMGVDEVMLIGGAKLYQTLMPNCDRMYITDVETEIKGDAFFPEIDPDIWSLTSRSETIQGDKDDHPFTICIYDRN